MVNIKFYTAITLSLTLTGFPSDNYNFIGFVSKTLNLREESLLSARKSGHTTVMFESPHRIQDLLLSIEKIYGENQMIWIGLELTKLYEKKLRGQCR